MISVEMSERGGRLGNQLFQYAVCKSVALKNNYEYHIPRDFLGISQLKLKCDLGTEEKIVHSIFPQSSENLHYDVLNVKDNTLITGFFQSEFYFHEIEQIIKKDFEMDFDENCQNILNEFDVENYCYVHLRGGDYRNIDWLLPEEYYQQAKKYINNYNKNIKFLVVTDDIEYSEKIFPNQKYISNDEYTDFYILSKCKYMIMSNSSFSWWTTYLNRNQILTIGPKRWFNYNQLERFGNKDRIVPEGIELKKVKYI